tara:strand:+ start:1238 stop:1378 length:141 start_codon:yes stop_codon:yes gene_type:complete
MCIITAHGRHLAVQSDDVQPSLKNPSAYPREGLSIASESKFGDLNV